MKFLLLSILVLFASVAQAEYGRNSTARSRTGFHFERLKGGSTDSGTQGFIVGLRQSWYVYDGLNLGLEINLGAPEDGSIVDNNIVYAGATVGYDETLAKIFFYDLSLMVGYGYGSSNNLRVSGESFVLQPQVGLGVVIVNGYRFGFYPGYLYTPGTSGFSNITFSLRFERKTESQPGKAVND